MAAFEQHSAGVPAALGGVAVQVQAADLAVRIELVEGDRNLPSPAWLLPAVPALYTRTAVRAPAGSERADSTDGRGRHLARFPSPVPGLRLIIQTAISCRLGTRRESPCGWI